MQTSLHVRCLAGSGYFYVDWSIFKPSGIAWRLGKCDLRSRYFQAKRNRLAARKMRLEKQIFSSQAESLGGSENAIKQGFSSCPVHE
jgi:hypothetical protein